MDIKELLAAAIQDAVQKAIDNGVLKSSGVLPEVMLEVPPQKEFGDFSTNFAMQSARSLRCAPRQIATAIVENLECASVEKWKLQAPALLISI